MMRLYTPAMRRTVCSCLLAEEKIESPRVRQGGALIPSYRRLARGPTYNCRCRAGPPSLLSFDCIAHAGLVSDDAVSAIAQLSEVYQPWSTGTYLGPSSMRTPDFVFLHPAVFALLVLASDTDAHCPHVHPAVPTEAASPDVKNGWHVGYHNSKCVQSGC